MPYTENEILWEEFDKVMKEKTDDAVNSGFISKEYTKQELIYSKRYAII